MQYPLISDEYWAFFSFFLFLPYFLPSCDRSGSGKYIILSLKLYNPCALYICMPVRPRHAEANKLLDSSLYLSLPMTSSVESHVSVSSRRCLSFEAVNVVKNNTKPRRNK